jgi:S1-C subfamily serine protease
MSNSISRIIAVFLAGLFLACPWARADNGVKVVPKSRDEVHLSFAPLVRKAAPAVVNIYTQKIVRARSAVPFFRRGLRSWRRAPTDKAPEFPGIGRDRPGRRLDRHQQARH